MAAFSSGDGESGSGASDGTHSGSHPYRVFIGSFNINSQDLSREDAKAWLKEAEHADIVALGLQECATVPANPFPEPTNGRAVSMWKQVKESVMPEASEDRATSTENVGSGSTRRRSSVMAGVAAAALVAASTAIDVVEKNAKATVHLAASDGGAMPTCNDSDGDSRRRSNSISSISSSVSSAAVGQGPPLGGGGRDSGNAPDVSISRRTLHGDDQGGNSGVVEGGNGCASPTMLQESYYLRGTKEPDRDRSLLATISDCIPGRCLVADVAMGETPTGRKIKVNTAGNCPSSSSRTVPPKALSKGLSSSSWSSAAPGEATLPTSYSQGVNSEGLESAAVDGDIGVSTDGNDEADSAHGAAFKTIEWYGTIRLLVFVRKDLYKDLKVRTIVIPAGDKPSVVGDAPEDYAKDTSPDKGAVACYLEDASSESPLKLLLVNCHLYGTNKHGVEEAVFDEYRTAQLRAIDFALRATLPTAASAPFVLLGDLNFRVEMLTGIEDKAKGGNDFKEVRKWAESSDPRVLLDLYKRADRLRPLLEGGEGVRDSPFIVPLTSMQRAFQQGTSQHTAPEHADKVFATSLLSGLKDGLKVSLLNGRAVRPTFTYKPGDTTSNPRRYNDKRTPSWTDRILWRGFEDDERHRGQSRQSQRERNSTFASVQEVISSDHEPIYGLLGLPRSSHAL